MHEIRASVPDDRVADVIEIARRLGIERVTVMDAFVYGPDVPAKILSIETSTPKARDFVEAFLNSESLRHADCTLTSRELRAVVSDKPPADLTSPMGEPFPDVIQELAQLSETTPSYLGRAAAGSILMAIGILQNDPVAIVAAALFLPFLPPVLAVSFGIWSVDRRLSTQAARAIAASTVIAFASGVATAWLAGGPLAYSNFKSPLTSLVISGVIGITAGLSCADDAGRRYLIGVAAAVQLAIFPVWFGAAAVLGLPSRDVLVQRLAVFVINLLTISVGAALAYAALHATESGWMAPRSDRMQR